MPDGEAKHLRAAHGAADVILEIGVGGSTVIAAEMVGKTITSVETDQFWVDALNEWFEHNPAKIKPDIIWANISPTKAWGRPKTENHWKDYAKYPLEIWSLEGLPIQISCLSTAVFAPDAYSQPRFKYANLRVSWLMIMNIAQAITQ